MAKALVLELHKCDRSYALQALIPHTPATAKKIEHYWLQVNAVTGQDIKLECLDYSLQSRSVRAQHEYITFWEKLDSLVLVIMRLVGKVLEWVKGCCVTVIHGIQASWNNQTYEYDKNIVQTKTTYCDQEILQSNFRLHDYGSPDNACMLTALFRVSVSPAIAKLWRNECASLLQKWLTTSDIACFEEGERGAALLVKGYYIVFLKQLSTFSQIAANSFALNEFKQSSWGVKKEFQEFCHAVCDRQGKGVSKERDEVIRSLFTNQKMIDSFLKNFVKSSKEEPGNRIPYVCFAMLWIVANFVLHRDKTREEPRFAEVFIDSRALLKMVNANGGKV